MKPRKVDLVAETAATFDYASSLPPAERAATGHQMWSQLLTLQAKAAALRTEAVRELRKTMKLREVAALLDLSVTRVRQIEGTSSCGEEDDGN